MPNYTVRRRDDPPIREIYEVSFVTDAIIMRIIIFFVNKKMKYLIIKLTRNFKNKYAHFNIIYAYIAFLFNLLYLFYVRFLLLNVHKGDNYVHYYNNRI